ncbi:hypothetical protein BLA29_015585, partial [Euroglyphus maynei]
MNLPEKLTAASESIEFTDSNGMGNDDPGIDRQEQIRMAECHLRP